MSEYSVERLQAIADECDSLDFNYNPQARDAIRAYASLLEQIELAREGGWQETFIELLEDYAAARAETAIWNITQAVQPECGIRMPRPRLAKLMAHVDLLAVAHLLPSGEREGVDESAVREVLDLMQSTAEESVSAYYVADQDDIELWTGKLEVALAQPAQAAQVDDAWRDAAADILGKSSNMYRMLCQQASEYARKTPTAEPVAQGEAVKVVLDDVPTVGWIGILVRDSDEEDCDTRYFYGPEISDWDLRCEKGFHWEVKALIGRDKAKTAISEHFIDEYDEARASATSAGNGRDVRTSDAAEIAAQPASPEQPASENFDRARETPRRQQAVEMLLELGWTYNVERGWEEPAGRQGEAVACRYRFGDGNGGWLGWHYTDSSTKKTIPGDVVQVEPLYTHPAAPAGMPVAWQQKRRPEDYPDEWRECGKETFDVINRTKDSPWVARELFECPAAPVGVPDGMRWAQGLIEQLPPTHDGRNSWLLNHGTGDESDWLRAEHARYNEACRNWRQGQPSPERRQYAAPSAPQVVE